MSYPSFLKEILALVHGKEKLLGGGLRLRTAGLLVDEAPSLRGKPEITVKVKRGDRTVPHFVKGVCGDRFPTPFAKPPG
jgi:hypothetical protein